MPEAGKTPDTVRFGPFELSVETGELRKNGVRLPLAGQPIDVLIRLVETPGELVTREELKGCLWAKGTVGDLEKGLNAAVNRLRDYLSDSATEPKYIETVPGRGYRFIAKVPGPNDGVGPGKTVSHYRILEIIGRGGMGIVYEAQDLKLGRHVALKFLPEEMATNQIALRRFQHEASTASSLNHPNICTVYEIGEHECQPFIVMELLQGQTLREYLISNALRRSRLEPVFDTDELLDIALQILDGLQAAHEQGIIHRDIKPTNIFVTDGRRIKILDFGLAKLIRASKSELGTLAIPTEPGSDSLRAEGWRDAPDQRVSVVLEGLLGSAGYLSPEQALGEDLDIRADLFSFGVVLYEMATGRPAFKGTTVADLWQAVLNQTPVPIHELNPSIPPVLEQVINKAMDKDRELRYQSAAELRADLVQLKRRSSDLSPTAPKPTGVKPHTYVLVAAAPRLSVTEWANEIVVWMRHVGQGEESDSQSSKAPLSTPTVFFHERTFAMDSASDESGNPCSTEVILRLDSPDFEPCTQTKKLSLPPGADSSPCTFLVKPCLAGDLVANLELLNTSQGIVASRSIRTRAILRKDTTFTPGRSFSFPVVVSVYELLRRLSQSSPIGEIPTVEQQTRFLEAAAPKQSTVGCSVEVVALVRESASNGGLRAILQAERLPDITAEDVRERPFEIEFPVDEKAKPQPLDITLRLESPGFDPLRQIKRLKVPPRGDSPTCTFLIVPRLMGEHVVNLELLNIHEQVLASRSIRTHVAAEGAPIDSREVVVTIPLAVLVSKDTGEIVNIVGTRSDVGSPAQEPFDHVQYDEKSKTGATGMWMRNLDLSSGSDPMVLVVVEGTDRRIIVLDHFPFTVGRQTNSDLVLTDPCVSRQHALLKRENDGIYLEDGSSRRGTFVNGERITRQKLMRNDRLQFGVDGASFALFSPDRAVSSIAQQLTTQPLPTTAGSDFEMLSVFLEAARPLSNTYLLEDVLQSLLEASLRLIKAERGFVFLKEPPNELRVATGRSQDGEVILNDTTISRSALRDAAESTSEFLVTDTSESEKLSGRESVVGPDLKSVICIPLRRTNIREPAADESKAGRSDLLGVLYFDSHFPSGMLSAVTQNILRTVAYGAARLVESAALPQAEDPAAGQFVSAGHSSVSPVVVPITASRNRKRVLVILLVLVVLLVLLLAFGGIMSLRGVTYVLSLLICCPVLNVL